MFLSRFVIMDMAPAGHLEFEMLAKSHPIPSKNGGGGGVFHDGQAAMPEVPIVSRKAERTSPP